MNVFERAILAVSPAMAVNRARNRAVMAAYDAAKPSRLRNLRGESGSGAAAVNRAGPYLRWVARDMDQNSDLVHGILNLLVTRTIGNGISVEAAPLTKSGDIHTGVMEQLTNLYDREWSQHPDVTGEYDRRSMERVSARSWYRDGEMFAKIVEGNARGFRHMTPVPLSVELMEADYCPMENEGFGNANGRDSEYQGIERNGWGRPIRYHFYKSHPGSDRYSDLTMDTISVPARFVLHLKDDDRINQGRGVSVLTSAMMRIGDLNEVGTSFRIRKKVLASIPFYVTKGPPDYYSKEDHLGDEKRLMSMSPGEILDDLFPGEGITSPPMGADSEDTVEFSNNQLRMICAGVGTHFSGTARDHRLTYTGARTEINEAQPGYAGLTAQFVSKNTRPLRERVINAALLAGQLDIPADLDMDTLYNAIYLGPVMPGPDPAKESKSHEMKVKDGFKSPQETIRELGGNPADVMRQTARWNDEAKKRGLVFSSNAAHEMNEQADTAGQIEEGIDNAKNS